MSLSHTKVCFTINVPRPTASHNVGFLTFIHIPGQPYTTVVDLIHLRFRGNITVSVLNIFIVNMPGSETAFAAPAAAPAAPATPATPAAGREEFMQGVNGEGPDGRALPAGAAAAARMVEQETEGAGPDTGAGEPASGTEAEGKKKSLPRRMMEKVGVKIGKIIKKT